MALRGVGVKLAFIAALLVLSEAQQDAWVAKLIYVAPPADQPWNQGCQGAPHTAFLYQFGQCYGSLMYTQFNGQITESSYTIPGCTGTHTDTPIQWGCDSGSTKTTSWTTISTPFFSPSMFVTYHNQTACANVNQTWIVAKSLNTCAPNGAGKFSRYQCSGNTAVQVIDNCNDDQCTNGCTSNPVSLGCQAGSTLSAPVCAGPPPPPPANTSNLYYVEMHHNDAVCGAANFAYGRGAQYGACTGNSISTCNCTYYETQQFADQYCSVGVRVNSGVVNSTCSSQPWNGGSVINYCGAQIPFNATPYVLQADWNGNNNNNSPGPSCKSGNWSYSVSSLNTCSGGGGQWQKATCAENAVVMKTYNNDQCTGTPLSTQTRPVGCFDGPQTSFGIAVAPGCPAVRSPLQSAEADYMTQAMYSPNVPCAALNLTQYNLRQSQLLGGCQGGTAIGYNGTAFVSNYFADYYCNYPFNYTNTNNGNNNGQPIGCQYPSEMNGNQVNISSVVGYSSFNNLVASSDKFFYLAWMGPTCQTTANFVPDQIMNLPLGSCFDFSFAMEGMFAKIQCLNNNVNFAISVCSDSSCNTCQPFTGLGDVNTTNYCYNPGDGSSQLFLCPSQVAAFAATLNQSATHPVPPPTPPAPGPSLVCPAPTQATTGVVTTAGSAATAAATAAVTTASATSATAQVTTARVTTGIVQTTTASAASTTAHAVTAAQTTTAFNTGSNSGTTTGNHTGAASSVLVSWVILAICILAGLHL